MKTNSISRSEPRRCRLLSAAICLAALAMVTAPVFGAQEQPVATPKPTQEGKGHHFVCTDYPAQPKTRLRRRARSTPVGGLVVGSSFPHMNPGTRTAEVR